MSPQAAVAAVRQVFQQYVDDWNAPNVDAVLAILADDVVQMPPDTVIVGKEALSADWRQYLGENADVWEPTIDEIQAAGNLVFIRTHSTETWTPRAGGESITSYGQGLTVFRRDAHVTQASQRQVHSSPPGPALGVVLPRVLRISGRSYRCF
jgi:ketosteroid isomerase-like protein